MICVSFFFVCVPDERFTKHSSLNLNNGVFSHKLCRRVYKKERKLGNIVFIAAVSGSANHVNKQKLGN